MASPYHPQGGKSRAQLVTHSLPHGARSDSKTPGWTPAARPQKRRVPAAVPTAQPGLAAQALGLERIGHTGTTGKVYQESSSLKAERLGL